MKIQGKNRRFLCDVVLLGTLLQLLIWVTTYIIMMFNSIGKLVKQVDVPPGVVEADLWLLIISIVLIAIILLSTDIIGDKLHIGCYKSKDGNWYLYPN